MRKFKLITLLLFYCIMGFAKSPMTICSVSSGPDFPAGDGSSGNPYIICNHSQFNQIFERALNTQYFKVGNNVDFSNAVIKSPGTEAVPFSGHFDGNGYMFSHIKLTGGGKNVALFSVLSANASIRNLNVNQLSNTSGVISFAGGLVGLARGAFISNIHIKNAEIIGPDNSGILAGQVENTDIENCSVEGVLKNTFGADGSGGLVGVALSSSISGVSAVVRIVSYSADVFGISAVGGLVGFSNNSHIENVSVFGDITYPTVSKGLGPKQIGGIIGDMRNQSTLKYAYFVGALHVDARDLGAAVGRVYNINPSQSVSIVWNRDISAVNSSALGEGKTSIEMGEVSFWQGLNFDTTIWQLIQGRYPDLTFS